MKTKQQILEKHYKNYKKRIAYDENVLEAMEEYAEQQCDVIYELYSKPTEKLKPLEDLYRKENPDPQGKFYLPDTTKFYEWIVSKIIDKK